MDIGIRNSHFESLYSAYANGDIDETSFCIYLGRTYRFQFGERLKMESPYTELDEIEALIKALGL